MNISAIIPTCNRKKNLLQLLNNLNSSLYPLHEVIIVDSSDEKLSEEEYSAFKNLNIKYVESEKSVCIQRNIGIKKATSPFVFLCDDDIEVPADYLQKLVAHLIKHPEAGALSGLVLQKENDAWVSEYTERSAKRLLWKYIFHLGIWGNIDCRGNNFLIKKIKKHYAEKGNHLSKAGWPVLTNFSGEYFTTPTYGLGASLIKTEWLLNSLYDQVLDKCGIGDNYGVAAGFPAPGIHIVTDTFVYHHREQINRLQAPLQYYRRMLALDYFIKIKKQRIPHVKKAVFLWSLLGNFIYFLFTKNKLMIKPAFKTFWRITFKKNPYLQGASLNKKVIEPVL